MLTRPDLTSILAEIRANNARLMSCPMHRFPADKVAWGTKWTCTVCAGRMDAGHALAYADGVRAAGGDPKAVWPHYEPVR